VFLTSTTGARHADELQGRPIVHHQMPPPACQIVFLCRIGHLMIMDEG
jgi:hypothetical protein